MPKHQSLVMYWWQVAYAAKMERKGYSRNILGALRRRRKAPLLALIRCVQYSVALAKRRRTNGSRDMVGYGECKFTPCFGLASPTVVLDYLRGCSYGAGYLGRPTSMDADA